MPPPSPHCERAEFKFTTSNKQFNSLQYIMTIPCRPRRAALADSKGFETHEVMVELHGRCTHCKYDPKGR